MNYELIGALGAVGAVVLLAFLYARASSKAALADQYREIANHVGQALNSANKVTAAKEAYIRELEKTVIGSMPAGKLVVRLNELFSSRPGRGTSTVPIAVRGPDAPKP